MPSNLLKIFHSFLKSFTLKEIHVTEIKVVLALISSGVHSIYSLSTEKNEEIKVINKYKKVDFGKTDFMIIDSKGRHFNVNNSLWYWKWDAVEDWGKIEKDMSLAIKYYGWRMPIFGLFPNIVLSRCKNDNVCGCSQSKL